MLFYLKPSTVSSQRKWLGSPAGRNEWMELKEGSLGHPSLCSPLRWVLTPHNLPQSWHSPEATVSPSVTLSDLLFTAPHATNLSLHGSTQTPYPSVKNRQTPIKQKSCSFVVHAIQLYHLPNLTGAVPHFCKVWGPDEILPVDSKCWYNPGFICISFHLWLKHCYKPALLLSSPG